MSAAGTTPAAGPVSGDVAPDAGGARRSRLTPEREAEIYEAVLDELRADGYDALTMDAVAARSHASKATLYRNWQSKPRLVAAALRHYKDLVPPPADTGSLRSDLEQRFRRLEETRHGDVELAQILATAVHRDAELQQAFLEDLVRPEVEALNSLAQKALDRGEVEADNPALDFLPHMLTGALFYRKVLQQHEPDLAYLTRFLDAVVLPALDIRGPRPNPC
jgi:AcrR family transcriptional regulator